MTECLVQKSIAEEDDLQKINQFSRRELTADEVYIFNVALCNNDIDRDFEKFSLDALKELAPMFIGKTGISDHSMKSSDQRSRVFDTLVERVDGAVTADGEPLYCLKARAYMLNNEANKNLIAEIDAGIKKEVSVSCSMNSCTCSVCGKDRRSERCEHIPGRFYNAKQCYNILSEASDAYEFSFVAVPAQREAGVTKSFDLKEVINTKEIIKSIYSCEDDLTISKSQARELSEYIDALKEEAKLGEEYKKQLTKEVVKLFAKSFPDMDSQLFSSVTSVMTTKELLGFRDGMRKKECPKPQLMSAEKQSKNDYAQFRI